MADSIYTFDPTAASNTALDSIAYGPNQLYHSNIDNWMRSAASKIAQFVDDLGGVNTVGGTANAITVTIASGITAYATGQLFWFKNTPGPNTSATTINVNAIGDKEIRLQGDSALEGGEMLDNGYYGLLYDAAYDGGDGGWILLNPESSVSAATTSAAGIVELANLAETLAGTDTSRAVVPANLYFPTGHIYGLTLSNNGSNLIIIAAGTARDATDTVNMVLGTAISKSIGGGWVVGDDQGGLDTGSVADTTYYIWLIKRSDTGVVDALFSTSSSAPTMPANYDFKVLIGEFTRTGGANGIPTVYGNPLVRFAGTAPTFACRAWMNFNGTGTAAARAAGNLTLTDNGTGDYTCTFVTNMPDANYAVSFATEFDSVGGGRPGTIVGLLNGTAPTSSAFRFLCLYEATNVLNAAAVDRTYVMVEVVR